MLIYFLSKLLHLFSELCCVTPYLQYAFPVALFIISGSWAKIIVLLYFVILVNDMIKLLSVRPIWYRHSSLLSSPYFRSHLLETINNYTSYFFSSESKSMGETYSFIFLFSSVHFEFPWDVQNSMFMLPCLLNVFLALFDVKQLFKRSALRLDSY